MENGLNQMVLFVCSKTVHDVINWKLPNAVKFNMQSINVIILVTYYENSDIY